MNRLKGRVVRLVKWPLRVVASFVEALSLFLVVYVLCAWLLPFIPVNTGFDASDDQTLSIYVVSNGVHTDLCLPAQTEYCDWHRLLDPSLFEQHNAGFEYVSIGWGDKGFYLETPTWACLLYTSPSPRDGATSRMPSSA